MTVEAPASTLSGHPAPAKHQFWQCPRQSYGMEKRGIPIISRFCEPPVVVGAHPAHRQDSP